MNKQAIVSHAGMTQDAARSKTNPSLYFEGFNIRITAADTTSTAAVTNDKGNEFLLKIPELKLNSTLKLIEYDNSQLSYTSLRIENLFEKEDINNQIIIGNTTTQKGFIFITTNSKGFDCIWEIESDSLKLELIYIGDLNLNIENPVQILNNYENNKIDKIYWVDGKEQLRFLNIRQSTKNGDIENLIDVDESSLNILSDVNLVEPKIDEITYGGVHTAGVIQYAYSYYKINGAQTTISPMSSLIPLGKSVVKGGDLNEIVGTIPKVIIPNIDTRFTNIRLYSVKYTSYNELPTASLIADRDITGSTDFIYFDDGRIIQSVTLDELLFLSGTLFIPKHIESKDSRLFLFNYQDKLYDLNFEKNKLDTRAYSFPLLSRVTKVYDRITEYPVTSTDYVNITESFINNNQNLNYKHSAINGDYSNNKYTFNSEEIGGEGPFIKYNIIRTSEKTNNIYDYRFFKENELYRIAIQFYNKYGIKSTPSWIADFVTSGTSIEDHNLNGNYASLKITLKPEFFVWLNTSDNFRNNQGEYDDFLKPVGFKILRAERNISDRTIVGQGIINGMISHSKLTGDTNNVEINIKRANEGLKMPFLMRRFDNYLNPMYGNETYRRLDQRNRHPQWNGGGSERMGGATEIYKEGSHARGSTYQFNQLMQFYSPEVIFEMLNNINAKQFKVIGGMLNNFNGFKSRQENWTVGTFGVMYTIENAISAFDVKAGANRSASGYRGLVGPPWIHENGERRETQATHYFREYSKTFVKNKNNNIYDIYGIPEISDFRASSKRYNEDQDLIYVNSLETLVSDEAGYDDDNKTDHTMINSVLTAGARNITFALGGDDVKTEDRLKIENLYADTSFYNNLPVDSTVVGGKYNIHFLVPTYSDLVAFGNFLHYRIGVLDSGNVYEANNLTTPSGNYDFKGVKRAFLSKDDYDNSPLTLRQSLIGSRILIYPESFKNSAFPPENADFKMYDVTSSSIFGLSPHLPSSPTEVTDEIFDAVHPTAVSADAIVQTYEDLESLEDVAIEEVFYYATVINNRKVYRSSLDVNSNLIWTEVDSIPDLGVNQTPDPTNIYNGGVGLICEFVNDESLKYIGNYYGGNSYESKLKTVYVEASNYFTFLNSEFIIKDPGDTFIQEYPIARLSKIPYDTPPGSGEMLITEVIKVRLESVINQNKRNDESSNSWDNPFFPSQGDFHSYNRVYSQTSNLIKTSGLSYEIKKNDDFRTGVISSHLKRPGEVIDNWTKLSINDTLYLDGKYGEINTVSKFNDQIITFQDSAVALLEINPRVQLNTNDGTGVHLGTGSVLHDYKYLSTIAGTLNKWGVISTNSGVMFYDTLNNALSTVTGKVDKFSDIKGLHSFLNKNIKSSIIKNDNHILKKGITMGYDYFNNDIYITFHQGVESKTLCFNELVGEFVSLHAFKPSFYFNKGSVFLSSHPDNFRLYQHKEGIYNIYYDEYYPSYIIYNLNFESIRPCIFNNINFKSEVYHEGVDQPDKTITHIRAFNEYQDTGMQPLNVGRNGNIRRRFRDWNAEIPRDGRNRLRNPWIYLQLQFDNPLSDKFILHDIGVSYSV